MEFIFITTRAAQTKQKELPPQLLPHLAQLRLADYVFDSEQIESYWWQDDRADFSEEEEEALFDSWVQLQCSGKPADPDAPVDFLRQLFSKQWEEELTRLLKVRHQERAKLYTLRCIKQLNFRSEVAMHVIEGVAYWITGDTSGGSYPPDSYTPLAFLDESGIFHEFFTEEEVAAAEAALAASEQAVSQA
jgi:hypothetical protein